jgi:hypothetical protein
MLIIFYILFQGKNFKFNFLYIDFINYFVFEDIGSFYRWRHHMFIAYFSFESISNELLLFLCIS